MKRMLIVLPLTALLLSACVVAPADHRSGMVVVPTLPVIVELGVEPYYYYSGYHYHYDDNRWRYSNSRSGPWTDLPRSHYPKETRFAGRGDGRGNGRGNGRDDDRDHDRRERR